LPLRIIFRVSPRRSRKSSLASCAVSPTPWRNKPTQMDYVFGVFSIVDAIFRVSFATKIDRYAVDFSKEQEKV